MNPVEMYARGSTLVIHKTLIRLFGMYAAVMISELLELLRIAEETGRLIDGYFEINADRLEKETTLSRYQQNEGLKVLEDAGIILTKTFGMPAKKHVSPVLKNFETLLSKSPIINNNKEVIIKEKKEKRVVIINKKGIKPLFEDDTEKLRLFCDSPVSNMSLFLSQMTKELTLGIDVSYYYFAVRDWSGSANKKRTAKGWIATARNFMRRDNEKGKLKLAGGIPGTLKYLEL
ncbi:MAG: hypothetical protein WC389_08975 [Lutibacter sp.]|jgi:hypothetical protein